MFTLDKRSDTMMDDRCYGSPSTEILRAITGFLRHDTSIVTRTNFRFLFRGERITVEPDRSIISDSECSQPMRSSIVLYESCLSMINKKVTVIVEYADPDLFNQIERFINGYYEICNS